MENIIDKLTDLNFGLEYHEMDNPELRIGARGIVINDEGKIALFNKQNKNEYKLPGGGLEGEEDPKDTFAREVKEETGCDVKILKKLGVIEEYKCQINFKQISHVYVSEVVNDTHKLDLTQKEIDEGARLLWVTPEEALKLITECIDNLIGDNYESVYVTKFIVLRDRKILEYYLNSIK